VKDKGKGEDSMELPSLSKERGRAERDVVNEEYFYFV